MNETKTTTNFCLPLIESTAYAKTEELDDELEVYFSIKIRTRCESRLFQYSAYEGE